MSAPPWPESWEREEYPPGTMFTCETCGAEVEAWHRRIGAAYLAATACPNGHQDERPEMEARYA